MRDEQVGDQEVAEELSKKLSQATACSLNKPENFIQIIILDNINILFAASNEPSAYLTVKSIGSLNKDNCLKLTKNYSKILKELLGINKDRLYIDFYDVPASSFAWNGNLLG